METDFFDIVTGVLQGDTSSPYQFIICLDNVLQTTIDLMKENGFTQEKVRIRRYTAQTIMDTDYADDIVQAESLLVSLERPTGGIGLYVNSVKTEYMCFNQRGNISTLNGGALKLMDTFTYLGSSVSSTENDINTRLAKAWTTID